MNTLFLAILFLVLALVFIVGLHLYLWLRLVRDTTNKRTWPRRLGTTGTIVLPLVTIAAMTTPQLSYPFWIKQLVALPGYLWMPLCLYLVLVLLVIEPVRWWLLRQVSRDEMAHATVMAALAGKDSPTSQPNSHEDADSSTAAFPRGRTRREIISRSLALGAGVAAVSTVGYGTWEALRTPRMLHVEVTVPKLPEAADGYRLAIVSDLHISAVRGRRQCQRIVEAVNGAEADAITILGDIVDGTVAELATAAEPLAELTAPDGVFFVTGNHEYYVGADPWVEHLRGLGLTPLENERVELTGFDLAGINDVAADSQGQPGDEGPDFAAALADREPNRAVVLMSHQPIVIDEAQEWDVDLLLAGHTHGGQIWPFTYVADLANPTLAGLEAHGDTQLYVTRGAGTWGPPVRVGAPSDITVVTLRSE
ncbi:metallophosphoesterase [Natronoglycomyces albus]|uniref:Metallophosphoesterase n=1 Tax=Natronoglycomyces albus TaxID=2811108 RepID=A0A895XRX6_9ACTN|nr:metallophosphoesterase [Natronoglycomyces albus]QSB06273.1 metallophosphoesterase [Natronoglycomyces albus]